MDRENTLTVVIDDPDRVLAADYDVFTVERSVLSMVGPFYEITEDTPTAGTLLGTAIEPFTVVGKILQVIIDENLQIDMQFTGADPLMAADVVSQINTALGATIAADETGQIRLTSTNTGTDSKIEIVGGSAAPTLGFTVGQRDIGTDAHVPVVSGVTTYQYIDEDGTAGYWYRTRYKDLDTGDASEPGIPFQATPSSPLDPAELCLCTVDLVDGTGTALVGQHISFYPITPMLASTSSPNIGIAVGRRLISIETDAQGHAEISLVKNLHVKVLFEGTSFVKNVIIPDDTTCDLLQLMGDAVDLFSVAVPDLPAAPRRTL